VVAFSHPRLRRGQLFIDEHGHTRTDGGGVIYPERCRKASAIMV
jgi:hypothetical protein